jgi:Domain of unknown function (DUF2019)
MSRIKLGEMTIDHLVDRFMALAIEQDHALLGNEIARVNRLYDQLKDIEAELKARPGDQRRALLSLYSNSNPQVRLKAVMGTLAVAPEIARQMLHQIAKSREYPQAFDAGMSIRALERGIFKPI